MLKRLRRKGDAASHNAVRRLRLAAAVGNRKRPSSRRPSPTTFVKVTNRFCQLYLFLSEDQTKSEKCIISSGREQGSVPLSRSSMRSRPIRFGPSKKAPSADSFAPQVSGFFFWKVVWSSTMKRLRLSSSSLRKARFGHTSALDKTS